MTAAEALVARLGDHGVDTVFGLPGEENLAFAKTAVRLRQRLTILVLRDDGYEFIGWHQDEQNRPRTGVTVTNPDIARLAEAFGCHAHRVMGDDDHLDPGGCARRARRERRRLPRRLRHELPPQHRPIRTIPGGAAAT